MTLTKVIGIPMENIVIPLLFQGHFLWGKCYTQLNNASGEVTRILLKYHLNNSEMTMFFLIPLTFNEKQ